MIFKSFLIYNNYNIRTSYYKTNIKCLNLYTNRRGLSFYLSLLLLILEDYLKIDDFNIGMHEPYTNTYIISLFSLAIFSPSIFTPLRVKKSTHK